MQFEGGLEDQSEPALPHERPHFLRRPLLQRKAKDREELLLRPVGDFDKWPVLQQQLPRMERPRLPRQGPDPL